MKTQVLFVAGIALVATACAQPPAEELAEARQATDAALAAGSEQYAADALAQLRTLESELEAELTAQNERFALMRSYSRATALSDSVVMAAEAAATQAETAREAVRTEVDMMLATVTTELEATRASLLAAPTGKGSAADLEMMKADVETAAAAITEAQTLQSQGMHLEARSRAQAATDILLRVNGGLTQAQGMRAGT